MADAADSKSAGSNVVWVQVPSPAYKKRNGLGIKPRPFSFTSRSAT